MGTRAGQKLSGHLLSMGKDFTKSIREKFHANGSYNAVLPSMFVNMDETAVCLKRKLKSTINRKKRQAVSILCSGSNNRRATVFVPIASDGKMASFHYFQLTAKWKY